MQRSGTCQLEALETAIYLCEVAGKYGDSWIENDLRTFNEQANPGLDRVAFKMAPTPASRSSISHRLLN